MPNNISTYPIYRFSYKITINKFIYEPVQQNNYANIIFPSLTNQKDITYIYDYIPPYGFGLIPIALSYNGNLVGFIGKTQYPLQISGFNYISIEVNNKMVWVYVPNDNLTNNQSSNLITQNIISNQVYKIEENIKPMNIITVQNKQTEENIKPMNLSTSQNKQTEEKNMKHINIIDQIENNINIIFKYDPVILTKNNVVYLHMVNSLYIDPYTNVTKLPINISSPDLDISSNIIKLGNSYAFILSSNTNMYKVYFNAELRINSDEIIINPPNAYPSIEYLKGSDNPNEQYAIAKLLVYEIDKENNMSININASFSVNIDRQNLYIDNTNNKLKVFSDDMGNYYKSHINIYNIIPASSNNTLIKRLITVAVTEGFSFDHVSLNILSNNQ